MPRIYSSANDPVDFCVDCFPSEEEAVEEFGDVGDGPDRRGNCFGYNDGHPDYHETDYRCANCNIALEAEDN